MDKYVTIKKQKNIVFGRDREVYDLCKKIENNETFYVHGNDGVGKTFLVKEVLKNYNFCELTSDVLRSKTETLNFLELIKKGSIHVLIDDFEIDHLGWKEIFEKIKINEKISNGSLVVVSQFNEKIDIKNQYQVKPLTLECFVALGKDKFPEVSIGNIKKNFYKSKGNIRKFFNFFIFEDEQDIFSAPKETIHNLLCKGDTNVSDYIGRQIEDHGYSLGIVHENYMKSPEITMDETSFISDCMSLADVYDNILYTGDWELCKYFCHEGIIYPSIILDQKLCRESLNPGSFWTKFNNYKMRYGKFKDIQHRQKKLTVDVDTLMLIRDKCQVEKIGIVPFLKSYNFKYSDMDVMNHLALLNKIKPKLLNNIKKELKKHEQE